MLRDKLRVERKVRKELKRLNYRTGPKEKRIPLSYTLPVAIVVSLFLWFLLFKAYEFMVSFGAATFQGRKHLVSW